MNRPAPAPDKTSARSSMPAAPSSMPRVSVLMSTYNGAAYLPAQLKSIRAQHGVVVNLHARDDGSTDATCAILQQFATTWPNLADTRPETNLGPTYSFLHLLRTVPDDADYFAFCDQDDVWLPGKLARAAAALANEDGPALYCSNLTCVGNDLAVIGVPQAHRDHRFQHILFENIATGCTIVLNAKARALINSRMPENGLVMHDWWCALVVSALGRIQYDSEPTLLYRQHGNNAVGMHVGWIRQSAKHGMDLLRHTRTFYSIHAQSAELLRLYGGQMSSAARLRLNALVGSKRAWHTRFAYALCGQVVRRRIANTLVVRCLILVGWY